MTNDFPQGWLCPSGKHRATQGHLLQRGRLSAGSGRLWAPELRPRIGTTQGPQCLCWERTGHAYVKLLSGIVGGWGGECSLNPRVEDRAERKAFYVVLIFRESPRRKGVYLLLGTAAGLHYLESS